MTLDEELNEVDAVIQAGVDGAGQQLERLAGAASFHESTLSHYKDYLNATTSVAASMVLLCRSIATRDSGGNTPAVIKEIVSAIHESLRAMYVAMTVVEQLTAYVAERSPHEAAEKLSNAGLRRCSFCGKHQGQAKIVAGPAGNICASCTRLACGVLGIAPR